MTAYLYTFRSPLHYVPTPDTFETWCVWQESLGARLKDRGYPAFAAQALGASPASTTLGGYSLVRASSLDQAVTLARDCPLLACGGAVEIGELDSHDDRYDAWLEGHPGSRGRQR